MSRPALLPGLILLGLGLYFLLRQFNLPLFDQLMTWPMILIIIGSAFMICSYSGWDKMLILPGGILLALGIHFLAMNSSAHWPVHWSMYPGAVGSGFLLAYIRTQDRSFLIPAGILLGIPIIVLGFGGFHVMATWWPIAVILIGVYLLLKRS